MSTTSVQLIRSATTKVAIGGKTFLVDPMLGAKGSFPGFEGTLRSEIANPTVDLPMSIEAVLAGVDAVVVSHTHTDHWDPAAVEAIPKDLPIFAQHAKDAAIITGQGFTDVRILDGSAQFEGSTVTLTRTEGNHGCCAMYAIEPLAEALGDVMGVVFKAEGEPIIYYAGDTIWNDHVEAAIALHVPDCVVLYAGYAMLQGFDKDSIIMGKEDTLRASVALAKASAAASTAEKKQKHKIITIHLEAINHCMATRDEVRAYAAEKGIAEQVFVPADGETIAL